jgi:hypothetical protein
MNTDVIRAIKILEFRRAPEVLKKREVIDWFSSDDPDVVAAAAGAILLYPTYIKPPLLHHEMLGYLFRNFLLNLGTVKAATYYGNSCYEAARELLSYLNHQFSDSADVAVREAVSSMSLQISIRYRSGTDPERKCIINGFLEHVLGVPGISEHFDWWLVEPELSSAYQSALGWREWSNARVDALRPVTTELAERLGEREHCSVLIEWPGIASVIPVIRWAQAELWIICDAEWAEHFKAGHLNIDEAVDFALEMSNWRASPMNGSRYVVTLSGRTFAR